MGMHSVRADTCHCGAYCIVTITSTQEPFPNGVFISMKRLDSHLQLPTAQCAPPCQHAIVLNHVNTEVKSKTDYESTSGVRSDA